mgnify:CR=1 FL=1
MNPRYEPQDVNQALGYLVEECGEVLAAVGKTQRWSLDSVNPELPPDRQESNQKWLLRELADLSGAIARVREFLDPSLGSKFAPDVAMKVKSMTDMAKAVISAAGARARIEDAKFISTHHLLLGVLEVQGAMTSQLALMTAGVTLESVGPKLRMLAGGETRAAATVPFSVEAHQALCDTAFEEALHCGHGFVGTEHILLALTRSDGLARQLFVLLGVDLDALRIHMLQLVRAEKS